MRATPPPRRAGGSGRRRTPSLVCFAGVRALRSHRRSRAGGSDGCEGQGSHRHPGRRQRAVAGRAAARALQAAARQVPRALDRRDHRVPRARTASGRSRPPTTSTPSAATGRPTRPSVGGITAVTERLPARARRGRCSSAWTRPSTTASRRSSSAGFTPKRIAEHEDEIRAIAIDVLDRLEGARPATSSPTSPSPSSRA